MERTRIVYAGKHVFFLKPYEKLRIYRQGRDVLLFYAENPYCANMTINFEFEDEKNMTIGVFAAEYIKDKL